MQYLTIRQSFHAPATCFTYLLADDGGDGMVYDLFGCHLIRWCCFSGIGVSAVSGYS